MEVSPAPETSKTSRASAARCSGSRAGLDQGHAALAARHQQSGDAGGGDRLLGGGGDEVVVLAGHAGGRRQLAAVGRQQIGPGIAPEIPALGIDHQALARAMDHGDGALQHLVAEHALGVVGEQHDVDRAERAI